MVAFILCDTTFNKIAIGCCRGIEGQSDVEGEVLLDFRQVQQENIQHVHIKLKGSVHTYGFLCDLPRLKPYVPKCTERSNATSALYARRYL